MTIKTAEITNYQSHKKTQIKPAPKGLTVITGTSHHGKSAIFRAIKWALTNRPTGFDFKSWFAENGTRSAIEFTEGSYVIREKDKNINQYRVSGIVDPLKSLRFDLPSEVTEISQMGPINIQSQFDPYFMLQDTPGEVGRMFNEIVGLEIIDTSLTELNKHIRTVKSGIDFKVKEQRDLEEQIKEFDFLESVGPVIKRTGALLKTVEEKTLRKFRLQEVVNNLEFTCNLRDKLQWVEGIEGVWEGCQSLYADLEKKEWLLNTVIRIVTSIDNARSRLKELNKALEVEEEVESLMEKAATLENLVSLTSKISTYVMQLEAARSRWERLNNAVTEFSVKYRNLLVKYQMCPVCGTPIGTDNAENIARHIEELHIGYAPEETI